MIISALHLCYASAHATPLRSGVATGTSPANEDRVNPERFFPSAHLSCHGFSTSHSCSLADTLWSARLWA